MKLLIIGASGLVGRHCCVEARSRGFTVVGTYESHFMPGLVPYSSLVASPVFADVIIFAAGYTHVDGCERSPELAYRRNTAMAAFWANNAKVSGAEFIYFSTSYIFDGNKHSYWPEDQPAPLNHYGHSKLKAEIEVRQIYDKSTIIRTMGVFGLEQRQKNFVYQVVRHLYGMEPFRVPMDQYGNATYAPDLATATLDLIGQSGIHHVAGPDHLLRRSDFAREIALQVTGNHDLIVPVGTAAINQTARRPMYAGLVGSLFKTRGLKDIDFRQFGY